MAGHLNQTGLPVCAGAHMSPKFREIGSMDEGGKLMGVYRVEDTPTGQAALRSRLTLLSK